MIRLLYSVLCPLLFLCPLCSTAAAEESASGAIEHDAQAKRLRLNDGKQDLVLELNYDGRCMIDTMLVRGKSVLARETGACSAAKAGDAWYTTRQGLASPSVSVEGGSVTLSGIVFGGGGVEIRETWVFNVLPEAIRWRIDRTYVTAGRLEDTYFPGWDFQNMGTWNGAFFDNGGVAWCRFFPDINASYGVHTGAVTFWNDTDNVCLRIEPQISRGQCAAARFSRQPGDIFSFNYSVTSAPLAAKRQQIRYYPHKQDVWAPFDVSPGTVSAEFVLSTADYDKEYNRGAFAYFDGDSIRALLNTIARVGAVDTRIHGSNSWRSGYAVLHEPWIAQMGLAIDDPHYFRAVSETLDYFRDYAIDRRGRVKSRWSYTSGDAMPGSYDERGFYECQWGYLLDSQPSFVINVAEQYDFTGDLEWVRGHKETCERVLEYLLRRDSDGDALVEMMTDSHAECKGSDWIDVIWAAYENAFVNAQTFYALTLWAGIEEALGDAERAREYRDFAARLKTSFNRTVAEGGFWNPDNAWYVYWRDKDDSIHGDNLVVPVNFMAIAYGLCGDIARRDAILRRIEEEMIRENLFFWPLCLHSYKEEEGKEFQFPFPAYENGDIFLAWGELGIRAYAAYDPDIPVKYVKKVLDRYEQDGLAYQRYLRRTQEGKGDDILANNCSPIVGLYRNIYGIQPKPNRLYLEPHLTPQLNGTRLEYELRNQRHSVTLSVNDYAVTVEGWSVRAHTRFGIAASPNSLSYFYENAATPAMMISISDARPVEIAIMEWGNTAGQPRVWSEKASAPKTPLTHTLFDLAPNTLYAVCVNGEDTARARSDDTGKLTFDLLGNELPALVKIQKDPAPPSTN